MRLWIFIILFCALLSKADPHVYPDETTEIQSCLSPDLEEEERESCRFYAAVIDAGSTGTRLHLFEFSHNIYVPHTPFALESETFKEVKPGLSAFAGTPERAAESVGELVDMAKSVIPRSLWRHTPITLKATAGLRLLAAADANEIIYQVERVIFDSGFLIDSDAVGILSGVDEGVFGWFTLNYLLERLGGKAQVDLLDTGAALDLGGGSTQLTFVPKNLESALGALPHKHFTHQLKLFGQNVDFFTHSYLGNGLIAARLGIAQLTTHGQDQDWDGERTIKKAYDVGGSDGDSSTTTNHCHSKPLLRTHCLPAGYRIADWNYAGNKWTIISTGQKSGFARCLSSARRYVEAVTRVARVVGLNEVDLYAFAYFYDRAAQAQLFTTTNGGRIRVGDYKKAAEKVCALRANEIGAEHWHSWQCLDLVYIYALLRFGYGLIDEKHLQLTKKLKNKEVSWALGAGFHLLNTYHDRTTLEKRREERSRADDIASVDDSGTAAAAAVDEKRRPKTCSAWPWYMRMTACSNRGGDDDQRDESCELNLRNMSARRKEEEQQQKQQRMPNCIFAQWRDYFSTKATQILVLFKWSRDI